MPLDFPSSPAVNDTYTYSGKTWRWNGEGWALVTSSDASVTTAMLVDSAVTSAKIADGTIVNADINASAAIADSKLATISTAGKVSNSATTATNANTASAIVARDASGNFSAGTITASGLSLTGSVDNTGTGYVRVSVGTTAQRPASPATGMIRFNTTRSCFEGYNGSAWVNMSPLNIDDVGATA